MKPGEFADAVEDVRKGFIGYQRLGNSNHMRRGLIRSRLDDAEFSIDGTWEAHVDEIVPTLASVETLNLATFKRLRRQLAEKNSGGPLGDQLRQLIYPPVAASAEDIAASDYARDWVKFRRGVIDDSRALPRKEKAFARDVARLRVGAAFAAIELLILGSGTRDEPLVQVARSAAWPIR